MSKVIASMLGQPEHIVKRTISKLEEKNGYPSHDVRLIAENHQKIRAKLAELGLDPGDTTAEELYHALLIKFEADYVKFDENHKLPVNTANARMELAVQLVRKHVQLANHWSLKSSSAKNLLRQNPPKRLMKHLNYRSLDSMLKREDVLEIFLAAAYFEPGGWQKDHRKLISQLDSTAYEMRPVRLSLIDSSRWGYFEADNYFEYDVENNSLALLPSEQLNKAPLLSMVVLILDGLSNIDDITLSAEAIKISSAVAWWHDMDGLIAYLAGEQVSFNIKDCALSHLNSETFESRRLDSSRRSFWLALINRYENQLPVEEDLHKALNGGLQALTAPANQPAFEYVEDI